MTNPSPNFRRLKNVSADFNTVVENLFEFRFEDYNQVFKINELDVPAKTYKRFPVFFSTMKTALQFSCYGALKIKQRFTTTKTTREK